MAGNHTPGPWKVSQGADGPVYVLAEDGQLPGDGAGWLIARMCRHWSPDGNRNSTDDANSRLIAAAPDLLAALEALNLQMPPSHIRDDGRSGFAMPVGAIRAAFAAIAKAKGEAS